MDIKCATCQEPWDRHHLMQDVAWDAWDGIDGSYSNSIVSGFLKNPSQDVPKELRWRLEQNGWKFGKKIISVMECPCCSDYDREDETRINLRKELRNEAESMLGDDIDGLASTLSTVDSFVKFEE